MKNFILGLLILNFQISIAQNRIEIEKNANAGDSNAQYELAELLKKYDSSITDKKQAFKWAMKSAKQGHEKAQNLLGQFYAYEPEVIEKDLQKATYWFEKSSKQNYCEAYNSLGWLYSDELKGAENLQIALDWFQKGIELNCLSTMEALGSTYLNDERLPNRLKTGLMWLEKAANLGSIDTQNSLGWLYEYPEYSSEGLNLKQDITKAVYWYKKAAENNDIFSMYSLANLLGDENQEKVYNIQKANSWYKKAADLDYDSSQYQYGLNAFNGNGMEKNIDEGLKYLRLAGHNNNYLAQEALGIIYCSGLNIEKDTQVGWYWLDKLINNKDSFAKSSVVDLAEKHLAKNTLFSMDLYKKAALKGNAIAQNNLGVIYLNGKIVTQDINEAIRWLNMAISNGNEIAKENLQIAESISKLN